MEYQRLEGFDDTWDLWEYFALHILIKCGSVILIQPDNTYPDWNTLILGLITNMDAKNAGSEKNNSSETCLFSVSM